MIPYSAPVPSIVTNGKFKINSFISTEASNIDWATVESFGEEWEKFHEFNDVEIQKMGDQYFDIIDDKILNATTTVLDVGSGSGRWSRYIANRASWIDAVDPSNAIFQTKKLTEEFSNVRVTQASVDFIPFPDESFDLVFSIGVLHHIPDTADGIRKCIAKVKPGGYFLVYLYYNFDQRGFLFKLIYFFSNLIRLLVCKLPGSLKRNACEVLAIVLYMPLVMLSRLVSLLPGSLKKLVNYIPLSYYRDKSFQVIRNDSLDRFGTPLEKRFSREDIQKMMENSGLTDIVFSENEPYWHAVGHKK